MMLVLKDRKKVVVIAYAGSNQDLSCVEGLKRGIWL